MDAVKNSGSCCLEFQCLPITNSNNIKAAELRHAFSTRVYCMGLRLQSNYGVLSQPK